jgi:hypothetical protein
MSVWEDVTNVAHLVMDHKTSDAHHGSTALVELGRALLGLPRVGLLVPSEVDEAVAEVAGELLSFGEVLALNGQSAVGHFHRELGGEHLCPDHARKVVEGGEASRNIFGTGEADTGVCNEVSDHGKHGDAAVLELDVTDLVEIFLFGVLRIAEHVKGVEEAEGGLDTDRIGDISVEGGRGGLAGLGRCEGGSGADEEGGGDDKLHGCSVK